MTQERYDRDRLYKLLPSVYQEQDAAAGYPLRALLHLITDQSNILQSDIQQLWDNFFIETCDRWSIPYIGDLVSNTPLHDSHRHSTPDTAHSLFGDLTGRDLRPAIAIRSRADVAKTIYYRRRKGTLPMLEELARDVTGWAAHAVAFFEHLNWSQNLNHLRLASLDCPDLRAIEPLDLLHGPFDGISHTIDVRDIAQDEGWYNIRNVGFFLWRLRSYPLKKVPARPANQPWQYHFSPLGNPAPLFTRWRREGDEVGMATELHVPGPIRFLALDADIRAYIQANQTLPPSSRPGYTEFYGLFDEVSGCLLPPAPNSSLMIFSDGQPIPPERLVAMNLQSWRRPPAAFRGVLSGELADPLPLSATTPAVNVAIEGVTETATFPTKPTTLAEAARSLEAAIRSAHSSWAFRGAEVVVVDNRLLILPGTHDAIVFTSFASDNTVTELKLDAGSLQLVEGVLSERLSPFPQLSAASPSMKVTLGSEDYLIALTSAPLTLAAACAALENTIHSVSGNSTAKVLPVRDRLLILPGVCGDRIVFDVTEDDRTTAAELKLLNQVGVDPQRGRIAFPLHQEPHKGVDVFYHYGFSADLGGGPYERGKWLIAPELARTALQYWVKQDGQVSPGSPPVTHTSLTAAIADWQQVVADWTTNSSPNKPINTIITILDSRTYELPDEIQLSSQHWLVIQAANGERPILQTQLEQGNDKGFAVRLHSPTSSGNLNCRASLTLSGVVIEGFVQIMDDLDQLRLLHSTLVPGRHLNEADGKPATSAPSLMVERYSTTNKPINAQLQIQIAFSITGPLRIPAQIDRLWLLDSIVDGLGGTAIAALTTQPEPGPPTTMERATILGHCQVKQIVASETIFTDRVMVTQKQVGCVRFSYVPPGSQTPRQYHCQPTLEITKQLEAAKQQAQLQQQDFSSSAQAQIRQEIQGWLVPSFSAMEYGLPGYCQLRLGCPSQIRQGAEDESEMGVFCHLKQPQRETNLRVRLTEYLPFGLDAGLIFVT